MSRLETALIRLITIMLFTTAFSKGLICVFTNPPWQAADEPMHLEAAMITGRHFPKAFPPDETTDMSLQAPILQVMVNHKFFQRVGIPEPVPLPVYFRDTPFVRDAPSKLGRQPLFYLLSGMATRFFASGILESLYLCRLLNLLLTLSGTVCLGLILGRLYPDQPAIRLTALFFTICHPLLWHMGSSMTTEAWKFFLISSGLFIAVAGSRNQSGIFHYLIRGLWFLTIAVSSWTLLPLATIILFFPDPRSKHRIRVSSVVKAVSIPVGLLLIYLVSDHVLIRHEFQHIITGFSNVPSKLANFHNILLTLFRSFWAGFGWLSVPVGNAVFGLFTIVSLIWFAGFFRYTISGKTQPSDPHRPGLILFCATGLGMVLFRALSDESSVQGRYLLPVLPGILLVCTRGLYLYRSSVIRHALITVGLVAMFLGDIAANGAGWIRYQHYGYSEVQDPVKALASFSWNTSNHGRHVLDSRHPESPAFFHCGWYPPESGGSHRWMMNNAEILLPMIIRQNAVLRMEINPFLDTGPVLRDVRILLNGHVLLDEPISAGWNTYTMFIDQEFWINGTNHLQLTALSAKSPSDAGLSPDRRSLSVAVRRIDIFPQIYVSGIDEITSGWFFTPDLSTTLCINPGDRVQTVVSQSGDFCHTIETSGRNRWFELIPDRVVTAERAIYVKRIRLDRAVPNEAVDIFKAASRSISMLPGILEDIYMHLFAFVIWLSGLGLTALLMVVFFRVVSNA